LKFTAWTFAQVFLKFCIRAVPLFIFPTKISCVDFCTGIYKVSQSYGTLVYVSDQR